LEQLEQLEPKITFLNLDYRDVKIETPIQDTIVYLDPPYRNTNKYIEEVNFDKLDSFFLNLPYVAFMSEYNAPFKSIYEIKTRSTLGRNNNAYRVEKLYINNIAE
jgi:site-specific DNA-adenine methylase